MNMYRHPHPVVCNNGVAPVKALAVSLLEVVEEIVDDEFYEFRLIFTSVENSAKRLMIENTFKNKKAMQKFIESFCKESAGYFLGVMQGCHVAMEIVPKSLKVQYSGY